MGVTLSKKGKYDPAKTKKKKSSANFIFKDHHERPHFLYDGHRFNLDGSNKMASLSLPKLTQLRNNSWRKRRVDPKTRVTFDVSQMYSERSMRSEDYETISVSLHDIPAEDGENLYEELKEYNRDSDDWEISKSDISKDLDASIADIDIEEVLQKLKHIKRRIKLFDGKENYKDIVDDLDQCEGELSAVEATSDHKHEFITHLKKKIKSFKQAINDKQQKLFSPVKTNQDTSQDQSNIHFQTVVKLFAEITNELDEIKEEILNYYGTSEDVEYNTIMARLNRSGRVVKEVDPKCNVNIVLTKEQYEDYISRLQKQFEVIVEESEKNFKLQKHTLSTMDRNRDRRKRSQILENNINIKEVHGKLSVDHSSMYRPPRSSSASEAVIEEEQDIYISKAGENENKTVKPEEEQLYVSKSELEAESKLEEESGQELYSHVSKSEVEDSKSQNLNFEDDAEFEVMLRKKESKSKPMSPIRKSFQRQVSGYSTEADDEFFDCEEFLETNETFNEFNNYSQVEVGRDSAVEVKRTNGSADSKLSFIDELHEDGIDEEKPSFKSIFGRSISDRSNPDEDSNAKTLSTPDGYEDDNQVEYISAIGKDRTENSVDLQSNRPVSKTYSERSSTQMEYSSDTEEHEHYEKQENNVQNFIKTPVEEHPGGVKSVKEPRKVSRITMKYIDELKHGYAECLKDLSPALNSEDEDDNFNFVEVINRGIGQDQGNKKGDIATYRRVKETKFGDLALDRREEGENIDDITSDGIVEENKIGNIDLDRRTEDENIADITTERIVEENKIGYTALERRIEGEKNGDIAIDRMVEDNDGKETSVGNKTFTTALHKTVVVDANRRLEDKGEERKTTNKDENNNKRVLERINNSDKADLRRSRLPRINRNLNERTNMNDKDKNFATDDDSDEYFEDVDLTENSMTGKPTTKDNSNSPTYDQAYHGFDHFTGSTIKNNGLKDIEMRIKVPITIKQPHLEDNHQEEQNDSNLQNQVEDFEDITKPGSKYFEDREVIMHSTTSVLDHVEDFSKPFEDLIVAHVQEQNYSNLKNQVDNLEDITKPGSKYFEDRAVIMNSKASSLNNVEDFSKPSEDPVIVHVPPTSLSNDVAKNKSTYRSGEEILGPNISYEDILSQSGGFMRNNANSTAAEERKEKSASVISFIPDDEINAVSNIDDQTFLTTKYADENGRRGNYFNEPSSEIADGFNDELKEDYVTLNSKESDDGCNQNTDNINTFDDECRNSQGLKESFDDYSRSNTKHSIPKAENMPDADISEITVNDGGKKSQVETSKMLPPDSLRSDKNENPFAESLPEDVYDGNKSSFIDLTSTDFYEYFEKREVRKPPSVAPPKTPRNSVVISSDLHEEFRNNFAHDDSIGRCEDVHAPPEKGEDLNQHLKHNDPKNPEGMSTALNTFPTKHLRLVTEESNFPDEDLNIAQEKSKNPAISTVQGKYEDLNTSPEKRFIDNTYEDTPIINTRAEQDITEKNRVKQLELEKHNSLNESKDSIAEQIHSPLLEFDSRTYSYCLQDNVDSNKPPIQKPRSYSDVISNYDDTMPEEIIPEISKLNITQPTKPTDVSDSNPIIKGRQLEDLLRKRLIPSKNEKTLEIGDIPINPFISIIEENDKNKSSNSKLDHQEETMNESAQLSSKDNYITPPNTGKPNNIPDSKPAFNISYNTSGDFIPQTVDNQKNKLPFVTIEHEIPDSNLDQEKTDFSFSTTDQAGNTVEQLPTTAQTNSTKFLDENYKLGSQNNKATDPKFDKENLKKTVAKFDTIEISDFKKLDSESPHSSLDYLDEERDVVSELPSLSTRSYLSDDDAADIERKLKTVRECMVEIKVCLRYFEGLKNDEEYDNIYDNLFTAMSVLNKIKSSDWEVIQEKQNILQDINKCMNDLEAMTE